MFKYNTNMLLENAPIIGSRLSRTAITNESYFNTALEVVGGIKSQLNEAKLELYQGISEASSTDEFKKNFSKAYETSFPKKQDLAVSESCNSTEHFIRYFGNAVKILNTAAGNIATACDTICNQAPAIAKESAKLISVVKEAKDNPTCPVCGKLPCTCNTDSEKLFKFNTTNGFGVKKIDFQGIGQSIFSGEDTKPAYDRVKTENASLRSELCGLKDMTISEAEFGDAIIGSMRTVVREDVQINKKYLDYCTETVLNFESKIYGVKSEAAKIAKVFREAADDVEKIMYSNSTGQLETDPLKKPLSEEETQELDLYCKAKVDEAINQCNTYLIAIGAKLDAIKSEYDQCKAVLAKYICGQDQPIALPAPTSPANPGDGVVVGQEPIAEKPTKESCSKGEDDDDDDDDDEECKKFGKCGKEDDDDDDLYKGDDVEDYNDNEDDDFDEYSSAKEAALFNRGGECGYAEAYESFLIDTLLKEAELTNYINATLMNEDTQLVLNEGLLGAAKSGIQKIMTFLKTIWGKFTNSILSIVENDQKYLAQNKNIILGNKPKNVNIENWYDYNLEKIEEGKLGTLGGQVYKMRASMTEINDVVRKCGDPNDGLANTFNEYFGADYDSKSANTSDKFMDYFRGTPRTVAAATFDMKDLNRFYNYCYNFKSSTYKVIEGEKNRINEIYRAAMDSIDALSNVATAAAKEKEAAANGGTSGGDATGGEGEVKTSTDTTPATPKEGADFAAAMDMYFSEGIKLTSVKSDPMAAQAASNTKSEVNNDQHNASMKAATTTDAAARADAAGKVSEEDIKIIKNYYDNVFKLLNTYVKARLTCAEGAHRDYMKFFRWHIGQYKGTQTKTQKAGDAIDTGAAARASDQQFTI